MSTKQRARILDEITAEREYQDGKWGSVFDAQNTVNDWVTYIVHYLSNASRMPFNRDDYRKGLVKAAALAVAALEALDSNMLPGPRHYDPWNPIIFDTTNAMERDVDELNTNDV